MNFLRRYFADPRRAPPFLVGALVLVFLFLLIRNAGIYPLVFVDEWTYSANTRMMPLSAAQVPSYLYFKLFQLTNYCGDGYLDCNRMLNSALYVLAAPFVYLLARRVAPAWVAVAIAPPRPVAVAAAADPAAQFAKVKTVIDQRCVACHSAHPSQAGFATAPAGVMLDSAEQVHQNAEKIYKQSVQLKAMPLANLTNMTDAERAQIATWFESGAK